MTTHSIQNPSAPTSTKKPLVDIHGLRKSGIFPVGRAPCVNTLRIWTRNRRIPCHRMGHFVYYDVEAVEKHIRVNLHIPARR